MYRRFRQPATNILQTVGFGTIFGTLFTGPFYYWKKGALIEGSLMCLVALMAFAIDLDMDSAPDAVDDIAWFIWAGFVLLSPLLLAGSYRRRGWIELEE